MTPKELIDIIACGETSTVQFKRQVDSAKLLVEEIVAFANSKGGTLLLGVEDKTGEIVGLSYRQIQQYSHEIATAANDQIRPSVYLQTEVVALDGKHVLIVYVNEGTNKPYKTVAGNIWVKQGPDKRRITENGEILGLFQDSGSYHADEAVIPGTGLADLEMAYINDYFQKTFGRTKESFQMPVEKLLTSIGILGKDGHVTRAGMLFFGQFPQHFERSYIIKAVAFYGNLIGGSDYRDSRDIIGTVPMMFREGMSFLKSNLHHLQAGQNFNSVGKLEIPEVVLEELLQNALVHADLLGESYIRLLVFDNRIEIINPGGLFGGLTIDDIRLGRSKRRNRLMADFCAKTMIYRGLGSGIPRALQENVRIDFVSDDSDFKVVLWRNPSLAETEGDDNVNSIVENGILNGDNGQSNSNNGTLNSDNGQLNTENGTLNSNDGQLNTEDGTLNKRQIMVLEYIASHPGTNAKEIIEKTGIPLDTLNKIIRRLTQAYRLIERRGSKKTGGYYLKSSSQE